MKQGPYLLGIDIGGTGSKAGVFTLDGKLVGTGYGEYQMISTVPGQAEHDAEAWWLSTVKAVREAIRGVPPDEILAIGIGCTNGLVAVDRQGKPLRPAIMLWDQRALPEVDRIKNVLDADTVFQITGNPVAPGAYSLPTILWLKHHEPETFQAAHKLMVPGGYLVARFTGEFTIDYSRASTTLLFDIRKKEWHRPFLEALDIPVEKLPRPEPSDRGGRNGYGGNRAPDRFAAGDSGHCRLHGYHRRLHRLRSHEAGRVFCHHGHRGQGLRSSGKSPF